MSALLRQISPSGQNQFTVSTNQVTALGRANTNQICLDPAQYKGVSSKHLEIRPLTSGSNITWQICDLNSTNGTFINGQRLQGCQNLQSGDRIKLGQNGAEFIFEYQPAYQPNPTLPDTQFDVTVQGAPAPAPKASSQWVNILIGIVVVSLLLYLISQKQSSTPIPSAQPTQQPSTTEPQPTSTTQPTNQAPSENKINIDAGEMPQYFNITTDPLIDKIPSGDFAGRERVVFQIVPKSSVEAETAAFAAYFYDSQSTEIANPVRILYTDASENLPTQLLEGQKYIALFILPSNKSQVSNIKILRAKGNESVTNSIKQINFSQSKSSNSLRFKK